MRRETETLRTSGKRIVLVPTMGALHEGHLSLFKVARKHGDTVVASIFVNPTQFSENEDYGRYPRNLKRDAALAEQSGCDLLFCPSAAEMYPPSHQTTVNVEALSHILEGAHRPTHFRGVTTVVSMLFNIVRPHVSVFGQKDYQQAVVIRRMIKDLHYNIEMVLAPIVREADGLAMSSRNEYLSETQRGRAVTIFRSLMAARKLYDSGERAPEALERAVRAVFSSENGMTLDYAAALDPDTLEAAGFDNPCLIAVAARIGNLRLIDNILLGSETTAR